jgi:hypothetical protein
LGAGCAQAALPAPSSAASDNEIPVMRPRRNGCIFNFIDFALPYRASFSARLFIKPIAFG